MTGTLMLAILTFCMQPHGMSPDQCRKQINKCQTEKVHCLIGDCEGAIGAAILNCMEEIK